MLKRKAEGIGLLVVLLLAIIVVFGSVLGNYLHFDTFFKIQQTTLLARYIDDKGTELNSLLYSTLNGRSYAELLVTGDKVPDEFVELLSKIHDRYYLTVNRGSDTIVAGALPPADMDIKPQEIATEISIPGARSNNMKAEVRLYLW